MVPAREEFRTFIDSLVSTIGKVNSDVFYSVKEYAAALVDDKGYDDNRRVSAVNAYLSCIIEYAYESVLYGRPRNLSSYDDGSVLDTPDRLYDYLFD